MICSKLLQYFEQVAIAFDQMVNALLGGWSDETLSARLHRTGHWAERYVDALFFWQDGHCRIAYNSEQQRKHLPLEYRQ